MEIIGICKRYINKNVYYGINISIIPSAVEVIVTALVGAIVSAVVFVSGFLVDTLGVPI